MKNTLKITSIAIAIISASLATFSAQEGASRPAFDLPTYTIEDISSLPEPIKNRIPSIKADYVGLSLKVKFTVTDEGRAESVRLERPLSSYSDVERMTFANRMKEAVENWKFEPAYDNDGNPITVKVVMPIKVVKKAGKTTALASLTLDTSNTRNS
jgi:outer membrane biosynthesis protein TonB